MTSATEYWIDITIRNKERVKTTDIELTQEELYHADSMDTEKKSQ